MGNPNLSEEEKKKLVEATYSSMLKPNIATLEKQLDKTCGIPTTTHQSWFQKAFLGQLKAAIEAFKVPQDHRSLRTAWNPLKDVMKDLQKLLQRTRSIPVNSAAPFRACVLTELQSRIHSWHPLARH